MSSAPGLERTIVQYAIFTVPFLLFLRYFLTKKRSITDVREKNWKKDTVYLYQLGRTKVMPGISPYSLKVETFLRLHKIPYENRFVFFDRSRHGYLPFIELNGEIIDDSQIIMEKLKKHFKIEEHSDVKFSGLHRSIERMIENHMFYVLNRFKMDMNLFAEFILSELTWTPKFLIPILAPIVIFKFSRKFNGRQAAVLGDYEYSDFQMLLRKDLDALRDILGNGRFFLGDKITSTDCSVFGMLVPVYYIPIDNYPKRLLKEEYPTIVALLENVKQQLWTDDFETK